MDQQAVDFTRDHYNKHVKHQDSREVKIAAQHRTLKTWGPFHDTLQRIRDHFAGFESQKRRSITATEAVSQ